MLRRFCYATAMPDAIVYLNGQFVPRSQAKLDIEDRGAMFADGVYEVTRFYQARPFAIDAHIARLRRSLREIRIEPPAQLDGLAALNDELIQRNSLAEAIVYWQVTRGSAVRKHAFPPAAAPTFFMIGYPTRPLDPAAPPAVKTAITAPDLRWHRCSIKSLMLLPNVLARQQAAEAGAEEAILHRDGVITEGAATSVCIVRGGQLWTHPANHLILGSITRAIVLELAGELGIAVREATYTSDELLGADEVFLCGTVSHITPIGRIDQTPIGAGGAGPVTRRLHEALIARIVAECHLRQSSAV